MAPGHGSHSPAGLPGTGEHEETQRMGLLNLEARPFFSNSTNRLLMMLREMMGSPSPRRTLPALLTAELGRRGGREGTGQTKRL